MNEKIKGCTVLFVDEMNETEAIQILHAICMIKGVRTATTSLENSEDWLNRVKIKNELQDALRNVLK